jgi:DNA recombination protein RmuC
MSDMTLGLIAMGATSLICLGLLIWMLLRAQAEAVQLQSALASKSDALQAAEIESGKAQERLNDLDQVRDDLSMERERREKAETEIARLNAQAQEREAAVTAERERLTALSQEMQDRFKALADEALTASSKKLLAQAEQNFKTQQEQAQGGVKTLVDPIRERLDQFRQQVEKMEQDRARNSGELVTQITKLSQGLNDQHRETSKLVNALQRKSTTRGQWGERTVENILELAGLIKGVDYDAQLQTRDSEGAALRPDFIIKLPGGGRFVVDSKVALTAFLDAVDAPDEATRKEALKRHAAQVKTHVKQLSKKDYAASVDGAIDFVALFIPGESFYSAAIEEDPNLFDEAIKAGVIITTPATLLALAKAVAYGFRQEKLERNAEKITQIGTELHERLSTFAKHMSTMGNGLKTATNNYNKAVASFEGRVLVSARRMADLNGQAKPLDAPDPIDETPRLIAQSEDAS